MINLLLRHIRKLTVVDQAVWQSDTVVLQELDLGEGPLVRTQQDRVGHYCDRERLLMDKLIVDRALKVGKAAVEDQRLNRFRITQVEIGANRWAQLVDREA